MRTWCLRALLVVLVLGLVAPAAWTQEAGEEEPDDPPGVAERLDAWFGDYITAPLWNYFVAFPLFQTDAVEVYRGDEQQAESLRRALGAEADIVAWKGAGSEEDEATVAVRVGAQDEAIAFIEARGLEAVHEGERSRQGGVPFIVLVLLGGGLFFTLRFALVHLRLFKHGFECILGRYDDPRDKGEITHFQALSSALSATLGLGNIAGVAIAIALGGPGAVFWMWVSAFFGMSMKFCECTLSQLYRRFDRKGHVLGGPMVVIDEGLGSRGGAWKPTAKVMAIAYAVFIICSAFGVALFQTKTSFGISEQVIPVIQGQAMAWGFGLALAVLVGIVVIGGIPRIGRVAAKLVPAMCVFYMGVCLVIILANVTEVPRLLGSIFAAAFTGPALYGGFFGVLVMGMRRGMFSNEAGIGSAAIAHSAARTREPVREGLVAMLGPFLDTIVICTMTALAILTMDVHEGPVDEDINGAVLTAQAFGRLHISLAYLLVPAVLIFAYSTIISWSYYGDRGAEYLLGEWAVKPFRVLFVLLVFVGPSIGLNNIIGFADIAFFAAAFPNIIAMVLLSGVVAKLLRDYQQRLASGEIRPVESGDVATATEQEK